ncbi:antibiotic biosynthesis monooxygenase [Nocardioides mesophilus]|uniref:Antibiotic biosynthesis monooxygenase n=1 Tax=Nocardioides mesophilus TaxID=433659 RepID=A0A7G9R9U4_9ACTN|nr:antibiotic biosynthesis monooxygenase [Nocardioides mesophilus]QNN52369.1 antibiotic biosynthesis monooxygenase [Nocardioides mesophilus]
MYARTITIDARPESVEAGITHTREVALPAVTSIPGCLGMSMVADREGGRCIATSAWESEEAMHAADTPAQSIRERAAEVFGATPVVEEWEMAVMHRSRPAPEGAWVRSTWVTGDPADLERSIDVYRHTTVPTAEGFEGFCSASLMVNRATGRAISTVTYESREALERTRQSAGDLRSATVAESGATVQDVREFELVLAHLHVPEMA